MPQLEIKNINIFYERVQATKDVSLNVDQGKIVCLLGANGAGKTTTLKAISGIKIPRSGEILFDSQRINGLPVHKIVSMGIAHVPENRRVFPYISVLDNLKAGGYSFTRNSKEMKRDIEQIFQTFPILAQRKRQQASTLSGGEQQMLAIGRGLMMKPKLLMLDEPTMGLSPILVEEIGRIITKISQQGVSILLVEQNANVAIRLADYGYVLEVGQIVTQGDTKTLINSEAVKQAYLGG